MRFRRSGYRRQYDYICHEPSLVPLGNLLIGGLIGLSVDQSSGEDEVALST